MFVAYYGYHEENIDTVEVRKRGLCRGEEHKRDNFKGATIRLVAEVSRGDRTFHSLGTVHRSWPPPVHARRDARLSLVLQTR